MADFNDTLRFLQPVSHGNGQVRRDGEVIAHFEYNGTVGVACPELYATFEAMKARWRVRDRPWRECKCGQPPDHVELWTDYGCGIGPWPALVCMTCMCIVGGEDPAGIAAWGLQHE